MAFVKYQLTAPQIEDANGDTLVGGTISAYLWDTVTPTAMYTDSVGGGSATSFTLNTFGHPSASGSPVDIFLDTAITYKLIIRDSEGTQVGPTIGPVYPAGGTGESAEFSSLEAFRASSFSGSEAVILAANAGTTTGRMILKATGTSAGTPTLTAARFTALAAGEIINEGGYGYTIASGQNVIPQMFGALGNGSNDDTDALQAWLDSVYKFLVIPPGTYNVTAEEGDLACLTLTKNSSILAPAGSRKTIIRTLGVTATTASIMRVSISDAAGFGDVRNWFIDGVAMYHDTGSSCLHGLFIDGGLQILTSQIKNCNLGGTYANGGNGLHIVDNMAHSEVTLCTIDRVYAECFDANKFTKNTLFGQGAAFTFDCIAGVRNNSVEDNTIVNRDGWLIVQNCDNLRFVNNQCEHAQGYTPAGNQNAVSAGIWVVGADRTVPNLLIKENNFGGGTNYNYSVYAENALKMVVDENNFIACGLEGGDPYADIYLGANTSHCVVGKKNRISGTTLSPRLNKLFKAIVVDNGFGNIGVRKSGAGLGSSSWSVADFTKNVDGVVSFVGEFSGGTTTGGDVIATLPDGFWLYAAPDATRRNLVDYSDSLNQSVWVKSSLTVTADATTSPDGRINADTISANATTAIHNVATSVVTLAGTTQYAISFYAKQVSGGTASVIRWELADGSLAKWARGTLDVTSGAVAISHNATYFSASSVAADTLADGWYRVRAIVTTTASGADSYRFYVTPNSVASVFTSYLGVPATHQVFLWGAQIEQAGASTAYQRTRESGFYETVFQDRNLLATTDSGVGYVKVNRQGVISVGSLPGNAGVTIEPYQCDTVDV